MAKGIKYIRNYREISMDHRQLSDIHLAQLPESPSNSRHLSDNQNHFTNAENQNHLADPRQISKDQIHPINSRPDIQNYLANTDNQSRLTNSRQLPDNQNLTNPRQLLDNQNLTDHCPEGNLTEGYSIEGEEPERQNHNAESSSPVARSTEPLGLFRVTNEERAYRGRKLEYLKQREKDYKQKAEYRAKKIQLMMSESNERNLIGNAIKLLHSAYQKRLKKAALVKAINFFENKTKAEIFVSIPDSEVRDLWLENNLDTRLNEEVEKSNLF
jgi:hypothetical protein